MQNLDVISVNIWSMVISLLNLLILFLILKKLLFAPVKRIVAQREAALAEKYAKADTALRSAEKARLECDEKLAAADLRADEVVRSAAEKAEIRQALIISEAKETAKSIVRTAEREALAERFRAEDKIRQEIVCVSTAIATKLIGREINESDQRGVIDSMISDMEKLHER